MLSAAIILAIAIAIYLGYKTSLNTVSISPPTPLTFSLYSVIVAT